MATHKRNDNMTEVTEKWVNIRFNGTVEPK